MYPAQPEKYKKNQLSEKELEETVFDNTGIRVKVFSSEKVIRLLLICEKIMEVYEFDMKELEEEFKGAKEDLKKEFF
jgi:ppGpp synthetase/RelA/SpoT-type nucleotidyltranferase